MGLILWKVAYQPELVYSGMERSERNIRFIENLRHEYIIHKKVVDLLD